MREERVAGFVGAFGIVESHKSNDVVCITFNNVMNGLE